MEPRKLGVLHISESLTFKINQSVMNYIYILILEFAITFTGVALLIRYYNHKA